MLVVVTDASTLLSGGHLQSQVESLKMATAKVETSVTITNTNSPSQDYTNLDD